MLIGEKLGTDGTFTDFRLWKKLVNVPSVPSFPPSFPSLVAQSEAKRIEKLRYIHLSPVLRASWRPILPHKTREGWGNHIQDFIDEGWASPQRTVTTPTSSWLCSATA